MANPSTFAATNAAAGSLTANVNVTASTANGDTLVAGVLGTTSGSDPTGITDTQGNVWTLRDSQVASLPHLFVFESPNASPLVSGTDVLTVTYAGTASAVDVIGVGVPGVPAGIDIDVKNTGTSTTASKATGTLASHGEALVVFEAHLNAGGTPSWSGGVTLLTNEHNGTSGFLSAAQAVETATTSVTPTATITSTTWNMIVLTYPHAPVLVTNTISGAIKNQPYSQTLTASGGVSPYTWAVTSGTLPTGLSLASGVISGTPTAAAGVYTFTVTATDSLGNTGSSVEIITISALSTLTSGNTLYANELSLGDSGSGAAITWAAETNAGTPTVITTFALDGVKSVAWRATANGDTSMTTGFYSCKPSKGYDFSGFMFSTGGDVCQVGVEWYTSGGSLIGSAVLSSGVSSGAQNVWQPVVVGATSPSNAAKFKMVAYVQAANAGDLEIIDLFFACQAKAQVLVDWTNDTLIQTPGESSIAGNAFMDVTPWVRLDQSISLTRGRQDAISDVSAGSAAFVLQNDAGAFTNSKATALVAAYGGRLILQRRCQVNSADEVGAWHTRFDGVVAEMDYDGNNDNTGNTQWIDVTCADVLAPMSRADNLDCWTRETVRADAPSLTWALDDAGNTGAFGQAAESSGNNGPPLRTFDKDMNNAATISWQDTTGGVETLADAVALTMPDGSEYWSAGSNVPSSPIRGLDSGTVGPYSTPLGSIFLSPCFSTQSAQNQYVGNSGYCLFTELGASNELSPNAPGADFSLECWFSMDTSGATQSAPLSVISGTPAVAMAAANKIGPYVQLSLGSARQLSNVVAGFFFNTTSHMTYKLANYAQPPAFSQNTWGSPATILSQTNTPFQPDRVPTVDGNQTVIAGGSLPHHLVLVCAGDTGGGSMTCWLDGQNIGSIALLPGQVFDTIYVGSAFGGQGAHFGNLSIASMYGYQLSPSQIVDHCSKGQYGMWEQSTDNCISQLGTYARIPGFWNNLQAANNGLSLTDYQDITGSNALTSMQLFEQAEQGLLFVNSAGQLTFHTRDWRMGYGAPDMVLPPGTYDASSSIGLIDQFQCNQAGFSTATYQAGAGFVNSESRDTYGAYTLSSSSSPTVVPLISFSRVYSLLGLPNLAQWPDPHLNDASAWLANTRSDPWLVPAGLQVDILAPDLPAGCPTLSEWYALDIDNMIAPSGTQPASAADVNISTEWFIEGINEVLSDQVHTLTIYVSPAETQRAWKNGDATYGVLGSTARIGISAPDLNVTYVGAKDVSHDAGPPYVPPSITAMDAGTLNNPAANGHGFLGGMDMRGLWQNMSQVIEPPLLIVGAQNNAQTIVSGATANPQIIWDTIYADTANGMGVIAGWPNWYVVTVPGFYEIDASIVGATVASGDSGSMQGWIVVCEEGAQGLASGLTTPVTGLYMCPIGEQAPLNNNSDNNVAAPSTCLYLGVGDMITVAAQTNAVTKHLAFSNFGGSSLSLRWISNSVFADKCRSNSSIASGGTVTDATAFVPQTSTWQNPGSVCYLGGGAKPQGSIRQRTNTVIRQGEAANQDRVTGSQYGAFNLPHASISAALTGSTLISAFLTMTCTNTFNGQQDLMLGWTSSSAVGSYNYRFNNAGDNPDLVTIPFVKGQTQTATLPLSMVTPFLAGTPALAYLVGNNSTKDLVFLGEWDGAPNSITLTVVYLP